MHVWHDTLQDAAFRSGKRAERGAFLGVNCSIPAKPKLAELQAQEQTDAPTMGGMNMK